MAAEVGAKTRVLAITLALAIFAGGLAAGIAVDRMWLAEPSQAATQHPPRHADVIKRFRERLDLSDDQATEITTIVDSLHAKAESLHADLGDRSREAHDAARAKILRLLTPEQASRYNDMIRKMHQEHHGGSFGPHRPGPHHMGPSSHGGHEAGHPHGP